MKKILEALKKAKTNKGFTLVELIIVIAIIAILAAILAPQYLRFVEDSRESNDVSLAASMEDAVNAFVANGELFPGNVVQWSVDTGDIAIGRAGNVTAPELTATKFISQLNATTKNATDGSGSVFGWSGGSTNGSNDLIATSSNALDGNTAKGIPNAQYISFVVYKTADNITMVKTVATGGAYAGTAADFDYTIWAD